jgi:hypothetical protein
MTADDSLLDEPTNVVSPLLYRVNIPDGQVNDYGWFIDILDEEEAAEHLRKESERMIFFRLMQFIKQLLDVLMSRFNKYT